MSGGPEVPEPFDALRIVPPHLRIPRLLALAVAASVLFGVVGGATLGAKLPPPQRLAFGINLAATWSFLAISLADFIEHFRLEHALTGKWMSWKAVPLGESINHVATVSVVVTVLILARPFPPELEARDWMVLGAPALYLALGWRDEVVFHRRRAQRPEDLLHATAHLASAVMWVTLLLTRVVDWNGR